MVNTDVISLERGPLKNRLNDRMTLFSIAVSFFQMPIYTIAMSTVSK